MLMVGLNLVNRCTENFEQWGQPSISTNVSGLPQTSLVDWNGSRHYQHGFNVMLSIGAPLWQTRLLEEITYLNNNFDFDAMFLDIAATWTNEQIYDDYIGLTSFVNRLHKNNPHLFITGEGWYDGLSSLIPFVQSGHTEGVLHWHDNPYAPMFDTYCRCFAHLCLGDKGRHSTGVHELGYNPITNSPFRKGIIPTITIVENTITDYPDLVMDTIHTAKKYAVAFLEK